MKTKNDMKALGVIAAVLLLTGGVADLQISHTLYHPASIFGKVFDTVGEFPAGCIASLCAMIIAFAQRNRAEAFCRGMDWRRACYVRKSFSSRCGDGCVRHFIRISIR